MLNLVKSIIQLIKRVSYLFFCPEKLIEESLKHTPSAEPQQLKKSINLVRSHVFRAFHISFGTAIFSVIIYFIFSILHIPIGHKVLVIFRFIGYLFVLWGIFSPTGWKIRTFGGETLPEIIDEEWHRLIYMIGLTLLLLSYLFEF